MSPTATTAQQTIGWFPDSAYEPNQSPATQWCDVTAFSTSKKWAEAAFKHLSDLGSLPEDWDGYGSPPVQPNPFKVASRMLRILVEYERIFPVPLLVPTSGGGLQFEWSTGGRELEIELLPDGSAEFLASANGETLDEGEVKELQEFLSHLMWLVKG